jgi:hypothetical protein
MLTFIAIVLFLLLGGHSHYHYRRYQRLSCGHAIAMLILIFFLVRFIIPMYTNAMGAGR